MTTKGPGIAGGTVFYIRTGGVRLRVCLLDSKREVHRAYTDGGKTRIRGAQVFAFYHHHAPGSKTQGTLCFARESADLVHDISHESTHAAMAKFGMVKTEDDEALATLVGSIAGAVRRGLAARGVTV